MAPATLAQASDELCEYLLDKHRIQLEKHQTGVNSIRRVVRESYNLWILGEALISREIGHSSIRRGSN